MTPTTATPTRPCVICGTYSTHRWCSMGCFRDDEGDDLPDEPETYDPDEYFD